jgi:hypothetical protein
VPEPTEAPLPDLVVADFSLGLPSQAAGPTAVLLPGSLTVANRGQGTADLFEARVYYRIAIKGSQVRSQTLATSRPLEAGQIERFDLQFDFGLPEEDTVVEAWVVLDDCDSASAAGGCKIAESNENNNLLGPVTARVAGNRPPQVAIVEPGDGRVYGYTGADELGWFSLLKVSGEASDPEEGALPGGAVTWTTDRIDLQSGYLGTGQDLEVRLYSDRCTGAVHTLTMTAVDGLGRAGAVSRTIHLQGEKCDPYLEIAGPQEGPWNPTGYDDENKRYYLVLDGSAYAADAAGRPIDGKDIVWTTDQSGIQPAELGYGASTQIVLYAPDTGETCVSATHRLTVTATDREGNQAKQVIAITIDAGCAEG